MENNNIEEKIELLLTKQRNEKLESLYSKLKRNKNALRFLSLLFSILILLAVIISFVSSNFMFLVYIGVPSTLILISLFFIFQTNRNDRENIFYGNLQAVFLRCECKFESLQDLNALKVPELRANPLREKEDELQKNDGEYEF